MKNSSLTKKLVLASSSPRRIEMLNDLGIEFEFIKSPFIEPLNSHSLCPEKTVRDNAAGKVKAVEGLFDNAFIIGCDTVVSIGNTILGKPGCMDEAIEYMNMLNGNTHAVYSGICILDSLNKTQNINFEKTTVKLRKLTAEEIHLYLAIINPMDKAGAYAIQGAGSLIVQSIKGCYYNVVGFPLAKLETMFLDYGVSLFQYVRKKP